MSINTMGYRGNGYVIMKDLFRLRVLLLLLLLVSSFDLSIVPIVVFLQNILIQQYKGVIISSLERAPSKQYSSIKLIQLDLTYT